MAVCFELEKIENKKVISLNNYPCLMRNTKFL